jgi:hypothetical protein
MQFEEQLQSNADIYTIEMREFDPEKDDVITIAQIVKEIDPSLDSFEIAQLFGIQDIGKYFPFKG